MLKDHCNLPEFFKNFDQNSCEISAYLITLQSGINVGPTFIDFVYFSRPYSLIKCPTFIKFWNFPQDLSIYSSLMGFLQHKFSHFVHALRLLKALCLLFWTNFPGPMVIPCPTSIPESRVEFLFLFQESLLQSFKWMVSSQSSIL